MKYRIEHDSMGEVKVPEDAKWGAQTERSRNNFKIGGQKQPIEVIYALVYVKKAAAKANLKIGKLEEKKANAIMSVADDIVLGKYDSEFPLVVWQTGSGTQTNMNVNEVIAHIANEKDSTLQIHPNDHVNMGQSSNDVYPTSMHIATSIGVYKKLIPTIEKLITTLIHLEKKYKDIIKIGRTHLQDATPVTFAQEVSGWRSGFEHNLDMLKYALNETTQLAIGGTAVGTGLNTVPEHSRLITEYLTEEIGITFTEDNNKFHSLSSKDALLFMSSALKATAANAMKMANDIRWLASGPRSGLGELTLPANEPGSSIMPGKVNPTQAEALTMVVTQIYGNDTTISFAASQGNFELNVFMPVIIYNMMESINLLSDALNSFDENCLQGLVVNENRMEELLHNSLMLVTSLNSHIGYDKGAKIAKTAFENNITLKEAALSLGYVTEEEFDNWVRPEEMV